MANQIYSHNEFVVICVGKGYIVINRKKQFCEGHTHLRNFKTAKYVADLAALRKVPNHLSEYLLVSLKRLTDSESVSRRVDALLEGKVERAQKYTNRQAK